MNKPKAPKDMTGLELINELIARFGNVSGLEQCTYSVEQLREIAEEPAPNPFTEDQLAWMREEQRAGLRYAAMDENGNVYMYAACPRKRENEWWYNSYAGWQCRNFLQSVLSWEDDKPLCFADYAPLPEGDPK